MASSAELEDYIKDFVKRKTNVQVEISWDAITINSSGNDKEVANLWYQILTHKFPRASPYEYKVSRKGPRTITLHTMGMTFTIWQTTGRFKIEGSNVKDWFYTEFKGILEESEDIKIVANLLQNLVLNEDTGEDQASRYSNYKTRRDQLVTIYEEGELENKIEELNRHPIQKGIDLYNVWMSLLTKWSNEENTEVFIATPFFDEFILTDIADLLKNKRNTQLLTGETGADETSLRKVQNNVKDIFNTEDQELITRNVFSKINTPGNKFYCNFIGAKQDNGNVDVLVTSANFCCDDFHFQLLHYVHFVKLSYDGFKQQYLDPIKRT